MPTLSKDGQIRIPADIRRRHGRAPGQQLGVVETDAGVALRPAVEPAPKPIDREAVHDDLDQLARAQALLRSEKLFGERRPSSNVIPSLSRDLDASPKAVPLDPARRDPSTALAGARSVRDDRLREVARQTVSESCSVSETVLLETAWVLKSQGGRSRTEIVRQFRFLLELPTITVPGDSAIRVALDDAEAGMDIADAFHRAFSAGADRLATFGTRLADAARGRAGLTVDLL